MQTKINQEIQTRSNNSGESLTLVDPYRRKDGRMDRSLLYQEVEFTNQALRDIPRQGTLLELCCATGEVSPMLQTHGFQKVSLDINFLALTEFKERLPNAPIVQSDALELPFGSESLDVIVAIHCFDLIDRMGLIQECNRVLRSDGLLVFDALNRKSYKLIIKRVERFLGLLTKSRAEDKWIDVNNYQEILQLISQTGFELKASRGYGWPPFSVTSNSRFVETATMVERVFRLNHLPRISPRIIVAVKKIGKI